MTRTNRQSKHKTSNINFEYEVMKLTALLKLKAITFDEYQQQMLGLTRTAPPKFLIQDLSRAKSDGRITALGDQFNRVAGLRLYGTEEFWRFIRIGPSHQELTQVLFGIAAHINIAVGNGDTHGAFTVQIVSQSTVREISVKFEHIWAAGAPLGKSTCVLCVADEDIGSIFQSGQEGTDLYAARQARLLDIDLGHSPAPRSSPTAPASLSKARV